MMNYSPTWLPGSHQVEHPHESGQRAQSPGSARQVVWSLHQVYSRDKDTVLDGKRPKERNYQMQFVVQDWTLIGWSGWSVGKFWLLFGYYTTWNLLKWKGDYWLNKGGWETLYQTNPTWRTFHKTTDWAIQSVNILKDKKKQGKYYHLKDT